MVRGSQDGFFCGIRCRGTARTRVGADASNPRTCFQVVWCPFLDPRVPVFLVKIRSPFPHPPRMRKKSPLKLVRGASPSFMQSSMFPRPSACTAGEFNKPFCAMRMKYVSLARWRGEPHAHECFVCIQVRQLFGSSSGSQALGCEKWRSVHQRQGRLACTVIATQEMTGRCGHFWCEFESDWA